MLWQSQPEFAAYKLTKGAMLHMAQSLATELGPRGIRVNSLAPSYIYEEVNKAYFDWLAAERGVTHADVYAEKADLERPQAARHRRAGRRRRAAARLAAGLDDHRGVPGRELRGVPPVSASHRQGARLGRQPGGPPRGRHPDDRARRLRRPEHLEPLQVLLHSYEHSAGLTGVGNTMAASFLRGALAARLMSQAGFAQHPAHADVAIERPVFVTGIQRSGTTMMQRLLHADPAAQGLEMWLTQLPQPRPPRETWDDDPVYVMLRDGFEQHHAENPELAGIHFMTADTVEECWQLLRQSLTTAAYPALAHLPEYAAWLRQADWVPAYERYRRNLQLIGLNDVGKRWVLKNPSHLDALDALMAVFPDALVVQTHRDPVTCVGSACSLAATSTRGWSEVFVGRAARA